MSGIQNIGSINGITGSIQPVQPTVAHPEPPEGQVNPYANGDTFQSSGIQYLLDAVMASVQAGKEGFKTEKNDPILVSHEADLRQLSGNPSPQPTGTHHTLTGGAVAGALNDAASDPQLQMAG